MMTRWIPRVPGAAQALLDGGALNDDLIVAIELDGAGHVEHAHAGIIGDDGVYDRPGVVVVHKVSDATCIISRFPLLTIR